MATAAGGGQQAQALETKILARALAVETVREVLSTVRTAHTGSRAQLSHLALARNILRITMDRALPAGRS